MRYCRVGHYLLVNAILAMLLLVIPVNYVFAVTETTDIPTTPSPSSPNVNTTVLNSTQTRLLVVRSSIKSIEELKKPPGVPTLIGISGTSSEILWLGTALDSYSMEYSPVFIPETDTPIALRVGVVDAILVTAHPSASLKPGIESKEFRLLPWSEVAAAAVVAAYPNSVIPSQLPVNTYIGQGGTLLGYSPTSPPITLTTDFTLTYDITFGGVGFIIDADNITLDLNGHTIIGNYAPFTGDYEPGVQVYNRSGITIKNGNIQGFTSAISLWGTSSGNIIQNITISDSYNGIDNHGNNNQVLNNKITKSTDCGIASRAVSSGNIFQNNIISACDIGIEIAGTDNQILGNKVTYSNKEGIGLRPLSNGNTVRGNDISTSGVAGIGIGGTNNLVLYNKIHDTTGPGIGINNNSNQVSNNQVSNSTQEGIRLVPDVSGNIVQGNSISTSGLAGISLQGTNNQVLDNTVKNSAREGIILLPLANYNLVRGNKISNSGFHGIGAVKPPLAPIGAANNTIRENMVTNSGLIDGIYYDLFDWSNPPANIWENNKYKTSNWP